MIHFHIITLFPESIAPYLEASILGRAQKEKHITVTFYQLRDYSTDTHRKVDDRPYGGGPGMVLAAPALLSVITSIKNKYPDACTILFTPGARQFTNTTAAMYAKKYTHLILVCGRYEGTDARVKKITKAVEFSIGPYVLTGGELPAAIVVDAITRHIPGVLGTEDSLEETRAASAEVYTRPELLVHEGKNYRVPRVLLSGDHKKIETWRGKRATAKRKIDKGDSLK